MKRILRVVLVSLMLISNFLGNGLSAFAESNESDVITKIVTDEVNIENLEVGKEVIIYENGETTISVELTDSIDAINRSSGDSGWSGGTIPWDISTLNIKCNHQLGYMQYKIDVRGSDSSILRAYNLTYSIGLWSVQNTSLSVNNQFATNYTPAYATATINAILVEYGIVIESFGGYLTSEINSSGKLRVTYRF